jgi:uncharacterized membrane protein
MPEKQAMSHPGHDLFENRRQFQLERMILFSDAVFAIAITLLIIELKAPELPPAGKLNSANILNALLHHSAIELLGFILSFAVIGQFWISHHKLFGFVNDFDNGLLWLNLHTLFWIVLAPFSSALNSKYAGVDGIWMWYSLNMFMISFSLFILWNYIGNPKRKLSAIAQQQKLFLSMRMRSLVVALIFLLSALLCMPGWIFTSWMARFSFILIFPAMRIINRIYRIKK